MLKGIEGFLMVADTTGQSNQGPRDKMGMRRATTIPRIPPATPLHFKSNSPSAACDASMLGPMVCAKMGKAHRGSNVDQRAFGKSSCVRPRVHGSVKVRVKSISLVHLKPTDSQADFGITATGNPLVNW